MVRFINKTMLVVCMTGNNTEKNMYSLVIEPHVPSTLIGKSLPQRINLFEDSSAIDGEALLRDHANFVRTLTSRGVRVIQLEQAIQDALISYMRGDGGIYNTLFEESMSQGDPTLQRTIDDTPQTLDGFMRNIQRTAERWLYFFNNDTTTRASQPEFGVELTNREWAHIRDRIDQDAVNIRARHRDEKMSLAQATHYALAWNNLLCKGPDPVHMKEIMKAYGGDHSEGGRVRIERDGTVLLSNGTRENVTLDLPIGSNMFFATDTTEIFSFGGDDDYKILIGNMYRLMRRIEPNLVRAGLVRLGIAPDRIQQPRNFWEGGNLIKFFGDCTSNYEHKAIYVGINDRTEFSTVRQIGKILHDFLQRHNVKLYTVELPAGGSTMGEEQDNMHLDFKANWFWQPDKQQYNVVLNEDGLAKMVGGQRKFYEVTEWTQKVDTYDPAQSKVYLPTGKSEPINEHFQRLQKEGVVGEI